MQRYNLFQSAHNTLQDVLFDSALSLQQAPPAKEATEKALEKVQEALTVLQLQARAKEAYAFPAMDAFEPAIVDAVKQQHNAATQLAKELEAIIQEEGELAHLRQAYKQVMLLQLKCMQKGEEMMLPVLWHYYSDAELKKLEDRLDKIIYQQMEQDKAIAEM